MEQIENKKSFSEFLSILLKWKKFLIINLLVIVVVSTIILLLIDNQYKSSATVIISNNDNSLPLGGMLSDVSSLLGVGGMQADETSYLLGILGSRELKLKLIEKFDLIKYYDVTKYRTDKTIEKIEDDYSFELNDNGMIDISFIHKNPETSAAIVNYIINYADSVDLAIHLEKAKRYREFIETRYNKNREDIAKAEKALKEFQQKTGLYVIPDQLLLSIQSTIEIEKQLYMKELELEILQTFDSPNYAVINQLKKEISVLKKNYRNLKAGKGNASGSIAFLPTEKVPEMYAEYIDIYRDLEIQNKILEILTPMYEQALMDEQKKMPTLMVLDKPNVPELKYFPKRSAILIIIFMLSLIILVPIIMLGEYTCFNEPKNLFEENSRKFYKRLCKFYSMKF